MEYLELIKNKHVYYDRSCTIYAGSFDSEGKIFHSADRRGVLRFEGIHNDKVALYKWHLNSENLTEGQVAYLVVNQNVIVIYDSRYRAYIRFYLTSSYQNITSQFV